MLLQVLLLASAWGSSWLAQCRNMITTGVPPTAVFQVHSWHDIFILTSLIYLKANADEKGQGNGVGIREAPLLYLYRSGSSSVVS